MKVVIRPDGFDAERAEKLSAYVKAQWEAPVGEENFFQFLAFMWLCAAAHQRMMNWWLYGKNPPN